MNILLSEHNLYLSAYRNTIGKLLVDPTNLLLLKRAVIYGVRIVNSKPEEKVLTRQEAIKDLRFTELIKVFMSSLTPKEFENIFPITKVYDGERYGTKDYFYSKDFLRTLPVDKPIGALIEELLFEYYNQEITKFLVTTFRFTDRLLRLEGKPGMLESFFNETGINFCPIYTDNKGKFTDDRKTRKSNGIQKRLPHCLKLIK